MTGFEPDRQRLGPDRVLRKPFPLDRLFRLVRTELPGERERIPAPALTAA